MEQAKFLSLAEEKYGDKVAAKQITCDDKVKEHLGDEFTDAIENYPAQAWTQDGVCPECNSQLGGLFGTFTWSIVHGCGVCVACNTSFRYYHYPLEDSNQRLKAFALTGWMTD